jgi:hypothetical protein
VTDSRRAAPGAKAEKPEKADKPASEGSAPAAGVPTESTPAKTEPKKASEPAA